MLDKLSTNLNSLMTEKNISAEELSRRTHIPASTIKKIRNQENPNPTLATLIPLAEFFSLSLNQLVGHESMQYVSNQSTQLTSNKLPILDWKDIHDYQSAITHATKYITSEHGARKNAYALIVKEENWENLPPGTILIIDPELKFTHRDFVLVKKKEEAAPTLKQILAEDDDLYLKPLVKDYRVTLLTNDYRILGVVIEYKKYLSRELDKLEFSVT